MRNELLSLAARGYAWVKPPGGLAVATFHRFGPPSGILRTHVRHHLAFMARHFRMVVPSDLDARLKAGEKRLAIATVDDCHRDIFEYLYPVAKTLGIPFVICVPTDFFLRRQWLWFDLLYWLLERAPADASIVVDDKLLRLASRVDVAFLKRHLKGRLKPERDELLANIAQQLRLVQPLEPQDGYEATTEAQLREMIDSGLVEICAHTVSHTIATVLPHEELAQELNASKRELQEFAQREVPSFCYPNGEHGDFSDETTRAVRQAGFRMAFTSVAGDNPIPGDLFRIRRVHAQVVTNAFEREVSGLTKLQHRLTGRRDSESVPQSF